ncbi:hypothetical protein GCM10009793_22040 [Brachybacterium phenoliresistens]
MREVVARAERCCSPNRAAVPSTAPVRPKPRRSVPSTATRLVSSSLIPTSSRVRLHRPRPGGGTASPPGISAQIPASATKGISHSAAQGERHSRPMPEDDHMRSAVTRTIAKTTQARFANSPRYQPLIPSSGPSARAPRITPNRAAWIAAAMASAAAGESGAAGSRGAAGCGDRLTPRP